MGSVRSDGACFLVVDKWFCGRAQTARPGVGRTSLNLARPTECLEAVCIVAEKGDLTVPNCRRGSTTGTTETSELVLIDSRT